MFNIVGTFAACAYTAATYARSAGPVDFASTLARQGLALVQAPATLYNKAVEAESAYQECVSDAASWEGRLGWSTFAPLYRSACEGYKGLAAVCVVAAALAAFKIYPYAKQAAKHSYALIKGTCQRIQAATRSSDAERSLHACFSPAIQRILDTHRSLSIHEIDYSEEKGWCFIFRTSSEALTNIEHTLKQNGEDVQLWISKKGTLRGCRAVVSGAEIKIRVKEQPTPAAG
jgi:hypothetical protein